MADRLLLVWLYRLFLAMDFLIVPTVSFRLLFVLAILRHERRRLISLSVTNHPTADWIARQLTDAFPCSPSPLLPPPPFPSIRRD